MKERAGDLHVSHKGKLDCGHLFKPTHALFGPPQIGRTMNFSAREKKSTPGVGEHGLSLGLLSTMPWVATLFLESRPLPGYPHPLGGSRVRHKQEWVVGAVASVFGNLLVPGVPPL